MTAIAIEGAPAGEIAIYADADGGSLVIGDALINMGSYGFTFLPAKYCANHKQMRRSLRKLLDYEFERILFAHGLPIVANAQAAPRRAVGDQRVTQPEPLSASVARAAEMRIARFLQLIRFSHTIFALPFALGALLVAADGWPSARTLLLVLACMVLARTAAMLFNRLADWSIDQRNPRTAARHLPGAEAGRVGAARR